MTTLLISFLLFQTLNPDVVVYGSLRDIMHNNDYSEKVWLNLMGPLDEKYGLGAVAGLDGEILILNGDIYVSSVRDGMLVLDKSSDVGAALLIISEVSNWGEVIIDQNISSTGDLEIWIENNAKAYGLELTKPFPFMIKSVEGNVEWHVVQPPAEDESHKESSKKGKSSGVFQALGFYGNNHAGVFTHQESKTHIHFMPEDRNVSAHVDELSLSAGDVILFPK